LLQLFEAAMSTTSIQRPCVAVLAEIDDSLHIEDLFARRGFEVVVAPTLAALVSYFDRGGQAPSVAIIDFLHRDARAALAMLEELEPAPARIGILETEEAFAYQNSFDAVFARPVDRARLFVRVVELVAAKTKGRRRRKLTGLVGAIDGNDLFRAAVDELAEAVPVVNAGAILEGVLRDAGVRPFLLKKDDLLAMIAGGQLAAALSRFGTGPAAANALMRISALAVAPSRGRRRPQTSSPH
jgi:hypothetical protein